MEYLGTFPAGFTELVKRLIERDTSLQEFLFYDESVIALRSERPLTRLPYLKNLYPLIAWGRAKDLQSAYQLVLHTSFQKALTFSAEPNSRQNFVIRLFIEGKPAPIIRELHEKLEKAIMEVLGGRPNSERPDLELQLHLRKNHICYLIVQKGKRSEEELPAGTLPPYLCRLLLELSNPQRDDIFLDPFMGSAALPLERARMGPYQMIFAGDIKTEKVEALKTILKQKQWEKRRKTIFPKVLDATQLERFKDDFITRIVSDPPWGLYEGLDMQAILWLYSNFLREAARLLSKNGRMVLLVGSGVPLPEILNNSDIPLKIIEQFPVLVSGQKALVYVIIPE